jgi:hypothetical protein
MRPVLFRKEGGKTRICNMYGLDAEGKRSYEYRILKRVQMWKDMDGHIWIGWSSGVQCSQGPVLVRIKDFLHLGVASSSCKSWIKVGSPNAVKKSLQVTISFPLAQENTKLKFQVLFVI